MLPKALLKVVIDTNHSHWTFSKVEVIWLLEDWWETVMRFWEKKFISRL